jgi:hypothetical protein
MPQISVDQTFPLLEKVIAGAYGPGSLSSKDHEQIWQDIEASLNLPQLRKLLLELQALQTNEDTLLMAVYARNSAYDFHTPMDARNFFEFFTRWIQGAIREA